MSLLVKNPLHPSALTLNQMTVGRPVIEFDVHAGILIEGVIASQPYVYTYWSLFSEPINRLIVNLRHDQGEVYSYHLARLGVIPLAKSYTLHEAGWTGTTFLIDARKKHLLPAPAPEYTWAGARDVSVDEQHYTEDF